MHHKREVCAHAYIPVVVGVVVTVVGIGHSWTHSSSWRYIPSGQ